MLKIKGRELGSEGLVIFSLVSYETIALFVNFFLDKEVIKPITGILGPLTHSKLGKIVVWMLIGWAFDHFYKRGENEIWMRNMSNERL